jgi:hypothetical protein
LLRQKGINLKRDIAKRKLPEEKAEALLKNWQASKEASSQKKTMKKKKKADAQEAKAEEPSA